MKIGNYTMSFKNIRQNIEDKTFYQGLMAGMALAILVVILATSI